LTATTYGNGAKISSRYDDFNRVTGVVYGEETAPRYEYDYNAKGQVARIRDNLLNRTTQSEYDLANRPVRVKTAEAGQHVYTGQVAYDNVYGNLSEFTEKVGENRQEYGTKFGYDDENRPTSLTYSVGATTIGQSTTTIDKLNRTTFSAVKLGSKTFTSEYHFAAGGYGTGSVTNLVSSITQPGCNCGYGYDDNGNIASATLNGKWTGYTYDALGQLVQVNDHSDTRSGENGATWKYTYDLGGNILKKERFAYNDTTNPLETVTYTYGDANWRDKLTAVNGNAIAYDAIGNPLNDGTWTYTWQNGRQLQKMQKSGVTAEFVYNADGLRVQKMVNGVVTKYTLHGKNVVHMTSGADELHFFYDAQNKPAVVIFNGIAYAYLYDLQGDVIGLVDNNGTQMVSYTYDAWGKMLSKTGTLASTLGTIQPFRYRGYALDEETELYYNQSRFYNPSIARFITADTTGVLTASLKSLTEKNLFAYCDNNPVMRKDIDGAFWDTFFDIVSLAVSVCEVIANPTDPWAWAGLAGDVVDLVPFVTGVGEVTRAVKAANKAGDVLTIQKAADFTDDAADIIKGLDRSSGFTKSTRSAGTQIHKGYKVGMPGKEYDKIKGIRIDYLDMDNKVIYELKPFNPRSVKQGVRQLEKYNQKLDGEYKMVLEVY
jgi:RHS repeat-associated protein